MRKIVCLYKRKIFFVLRKQKIFFLYKKICSPYKMKIFRWYEKTILLLYNICISIFGSFWDRLGLDP